MNELRKRFPLLMPVNHKLTEFYGYIKVLNEDFKIHVILPDERNLKKLKLSGEWRLQQQLVKSGYNIVEVLERCNSLDEFLIELQNHLEQQIRLENKANVIELPPSYYKDLLVQLEKLGWKKLKYINDQWNKIHLEAIDSCGRSHILQLIIPNDYPNKMPECITNLPQFNLNTLKKTNLDVIYKEFESKLKDYQIFWNCMDEIDNNVWVLEPNHPSREDCKRRIAIGPNSSLQINVDPNNPTAIPECYFYGPEQIVGPLKGLFRSNLETWNENCSLLYNLQSLLNINFPLKSEINREELHLDCGICYSYQLNNTLPDILCENSKCLQPYHLNCLYEWLKSLPTTRHSFNIMFGECPYCEQPIMCKNVHHMKENNE
ncbi:E3 ubiquitin-protein ligase FANCL isoform X2 [Centruroides vittatus]|uniref:E3 ubiquitin-protein ligase FANCL isoform X2 n=1 Tax=Centruroides vittatus TaxID=120091 RepID=UPI003510AD24